jgi:hypothetical protein
MKVPNVGVEKENLGPPREKATVIITQLQCQDVVLHFQTFGECAETKGSNSCAHNPNATFSIEKNTKYRFKEALYEAHS